MGWSGWTISSARLGTKKQFQRKPFAQICTHNILESYFVPFSLWSCLPWFVSTMESDSWSMHRVQHHGVLLIVLNFRRFAPIQLLPAANRIYTRYLEFSWGRNEYLGMKVTVTHCSGDSIESKGSWTAFVLQYASLHYRALTCPCSRSAGACLNKPR